MENINEIKALAKLNLSLEILNKRADGYHNLLSLMSKINLFDLLKLKDITEKKDSSFPNISIKAVDGIYKDFFNRIPLTENLIYRAAFEYLTICNISCNLKIEVVKNIPAGGGLGGGSADAAGILIILNSIFGKLEKDDLYRLAGKLGADVPFCLNDKLAICEGIGDIIEPIPGNLKASILIINDNISVNTGEAYRKLNRTNYFDYPECLLSEKKQIFREAVAENNICKLLPYCKNDFEEPVFLSYPLIREIKEDICNSNAVFSQMSGSGSTVFGVFLDDNDAKKTFNKLKKKYANVVLTELV